MGITKSRKWRIVPRCRLLELLLLGLLPILLVFPFRPFLCHPVTIRLAEAVLFRVFAVTVRSAGPEPLPSGAERPGEARFYRQQEEGKEGARWCRRAMAVGETYLGPWHQLQFYYRSDCTPSAANSGRAVNRVTLAARYASRTWNGITVQDVAELRTGTGETMWFGLGFGLVAWEAPWGSSAISEVHRPGERPDNVRETIGCMN